MKDQITKKTKEFIDDMFSKEAKKNLDNVSKCSSCDCNCDLLNYLINKAWQDATMRERMNKTSAIIANKSKIVAKLVDEIKNNFGAICANFDKWHNDMCSDTTYGMRYGVWQKLINMTFKYIYSINAITGKCFDFLSSTWDKCHCPIDSYISNPLYNELVSLSSTNTLITKSDLDMVKSIEKNGEHPCKITWNNINPLQYKRYQELVKIVCDKYHISPVEFDVLFWEQKKK